jgi:plastocyanin
MIPRLRRGVRTYSVPLVAGVLAVTTACGSEAQPQLTGDDLVVEMFDNRFAAEELHVPVGGSVTFVGAGLAPHNAAAADGSWSTESSFGGLEQFDGDAATLTFDQPGEYPFFCTFHGNAEGGGMAGTLIVGSPGASAVAQGATETVAPSEWSGQTRRVPQDHTTIQDAVDAAGPGDLVLVDRGVYSEQVTVTTPGIVIRGVDRNETIIDGEYLRENGVEVFEADGVAVENLTVRNTMVNGLFWTGVRGYRASYVTAVNARVYGIYAFDSSDGVFEHSYASGSYDAGFYIGQCDPCDAVITRSLAEWNGLGYSGSNASTELYLIDSVWRYNGSGIVPNTIDGELLAPFHDVTIIGNLVHDNGNTENPTGNTEWSAWGNGILLAGGNDSLVQRNRVVNHPVGGIVITPNLDRNFWTASRNVVRDNVIEGSGRADLALAGPAGTQNCFEGNDPSFTLPVALEVFQSCDGLRLPVLFELGGSTEQLGRLLENGLGLRPDPAHGSAPVPGPQPQMPGGADAAVVPAVHVFASYPLDLESLTVPDLVGITVTQTKGFTMFGVLFASAASVFFGLYAYFLPFVLYAAWVAIALWDLARREDLGRGATIAWTAMILVVPFIGVIVYHIAGKSPIPAWHRATFVGGGFAAYLVILAIGAVVGGIV